MKQLIDELLSHATNANMNFIKELSEYIIENKINDINDLKDNYNIAKLFNRINLSINKWDELNVSQTKELYSLKHDFNNQNEEEQIKRIIKMHAILDFELVYKFVTYNMIINDEL